MTDRFSTYSISGRQQLLNSEKAYNVPPAGQLLFRGMTKSLFIITKNTYNLY